MIAKKRKDGSLRVNEIFEQYAIKHGLNQRYFENLGNALKERSRLVHGVSGSAKSKVIDEGFKMVLHASVAITAYVDEHCKRKMFQRIVRRSACNKCEDKSFCPKIRREGAK